MFDRVILPSWRHSLYPVIYGSEDCAPGHRYGPAVRPYYLIHYIFQGEGDYFCPQGKFHLTAGDLFMISPGIVTTYQADTENPWKYGWLGFHAENPPAVLSQPVLRQQSVRRIFQALAGMPAEHTDGMIFALAHKLMWILEDSDAEAAPGRYAEYARAYLDANYMGNVSIQAIADALHIDRRYLTARFRDRFGVPPQTYLTDLRLEKARAFLIQGFPVTQAAAMAGFADLPGFSRQYRRRYGICPSREPKEFP